LQFHPHKGGGANDRQFTVINNYVL
jgi:hypothetical protein